VPLYFVKKGKNSKEQHQRNKTTFFIGWGGKMKKKGGEKTCREYIDT